MHSKTRHLVWQRALLVLLSACGESQADLVADLPARMAQARCDALHACVAGEVELFLNNQDCVVTQQRMYEDSELGDLKRSIEAGTLVVEAAAIDTCINSMRSWGCLAYSTGLPFECEQALQGTVPLGGPCNHDLECAMDGWCDFGASCPGVCTLPNGPGVFCSRDHECQPGLQCDDTCHVPLELGSSCSGSLTHSECRHGEYCASDRCVTFDQLLGAAPGQPCDPVTGQLCQIGLACQVLDFQAGWLCGPLLELGSTCGLGVPNPCSPGLYCAGIQATLWPVPVITPGVCSPVSQPGQPCELPPLLDEDLAPTQSCAAYHRCDMGSRICKPIQRIGGPCTSNDECYSDVCDADACRIAHECAPT